MQHTRPSRHPAGRASFLGVRLLLGLALALPGCGGGDSTTPTPTPTPTPGPTQANVTVTINNPTYGPGGTAGFGYSLEFGLNVRESAGLGANINFVRLEIFNASGSLLERSENGANTVPGGNRLNPNSSRDFNVILGFNSDPLNGRYVVIRLGTTDDRGHAQVASSTNLLF